MSVDNPQVYPGLTDRYRRTVALVKLSATDCYLVDCFEVQGGKQHDYFLHGSADEPQTLTAQVGDIAFESGDDEITLVPIGGWPQKLGPDIEMPQLRLTAGAVPVALAVDGKPLLHDDRAAMRALAFSDPAARARLESILHPMIRDLSAARIAAAR